MQVVQIHQLTHSSMVMYPHFSLSLFLFLLLALFVCIKKKERSSARIKERIKFYPYGSKSHVCQSSFTPGIWHNFVTMDDPKLIMMMVITSAHLLPTQLHLDSYNEAYRTKANTVRRLPRRRDHDQQQQQQKNPLSRQTYQTGYVFPSRIPQPPSGPLGFNKSLRPMPHPIYSRTIFFFFSWLSILNFLLSM